MPHVCRVALSSRERDPGAAWEASVCAGACPGAAGANTSRVGVCRSCACLVRPPDLVGPPDPPTCPKGRGARTSAHPLLRRPAPLVPRPHPAGPTPPPPKGRDPAPDPAPRVRACAVTAGAVGSTARTAGHSWGRLPLFPAVLTPQSSSTGARAALAGDGGGGRARGPRLAWRRLPAPGQPDLQPGAGRRKPLAVGAGVGAGVRARVGAGAGGR